MDKLVSIIVPVFNAEKYIEECIRSIQRQTYTNLEILLIDDGSTDNGGKICDEFANKDSRIRVIHKENGGVSSARNTGLSLARGEFISFVDSDDFVHEEYISALYNGITETGSDISFCGYLELTNDETVEVKENLPDRINVDLHDKTFVEFFLRFFSFKQYIMGSCCRILFKKELADGIAFDPDIKISEDLLFLINIILKAKMVTSVDRYLYFYRQAGASARYSYKKNYLCSQLKLCSELKKVFDLFDDEACLKELRIYTCLLCYYVISNELKFKQPNRKATVQSVRDCELYEYFTLRNGLGIYGGTHKVKFLIAWFLTKARVI